MSEEITRDNWNVVTIEGRRASREAEPSQPGTALWFDVAAWDEDKIPPRPWIADGYILRGAVTVLAGAGAAGKSMLSLGWAVSLALGTPWGRFKPRAACRVLTVNMEDDEDEQRRRLSAVLRQHRAKPSDIVGKIVRGGPNAVGTLFESEGYAGPLRRTQAMADLESRIVEFAPDVVFLDPLAELHNVNENDNNAFGAVIAQFRSMAKRHNIAIVLVHHFRKGISDAGDPDAIRGAVSLIGAARVALTVMTMSKDDAATLGIDEAGRRNYFRLDGAKSNYAPVSEVEWYIRQEHCLGNGEWVAAAEPWSPAAVFQAMDAQACNRALDRIAEGPEPGLLYSPSNAGRGNGRWVGSVLVEQHGLAEGPASRIIGAWLASGLLFKHKFTNPATRKEVNGVQVDNSRRPS